MIQIYKLRQSTNNQITHINTNIKAKNINSLFDNVDKIVANIPPNERHNIFYTTAHCTGSRVFESQDIIPIDIDDVNVDQLELYAPAICSGLSVDITKTTIVASGNGVHIIIQLQEHITDLQPYKQKYKSLCKKIDGILNEAGLQGKTDSTIWSNARILRLPGTLNIKPILSNGQPQTTKKCYIMMNQLAPQAFQWPEIVTPSTTPTKLQRPVRSSDIVSQAPATGPDVQNDPYSDWMPEVDAIMGDTGCGFLIGEMTTGGRDSSEPTWYAAIGVTAFFKDNDTIGHELSKYHPTYTVEGTNRKCEQARMSSGPSTCARIAEFYDCSKCPHLGKIVSPISIKDDVKRIEREQIKKPRPESRSAPAAVNMVQTIQEVDTSIKPENEKRNEVEKENEPKKDSGFEEDIRTGFTEYVKKKMIRRYDRLLEYFQFLHPHVRLTDIKRTMIFRDNFWQKIYDEDIKNFCNTSFFPPPRENERVEFLKLIHSTNTTTSEFLNSSSEYLLNLNNGVLDIQNEILLPHSPSFNFIYKLDYDYNKNADCPTWNDLLKNVSCGREEIIDSLEEFLGYCLTNSKYIFAKILILAGKGANGKSTVINAFAEMLGHDNYSSLEISTLNQRFHAASLEGKLANFSEEEPVSCFKKESGMIKKITGNSRIYVEHKYEGGYTMLNKAKIILSYNDMPWLNDITHGMRRRLLIIPFDLDLTKNPEKKIKDVLERVSGERSGVLNRALKAWKQVVKQDGFTTPKESLEELEHLVSYSMDDIQTWFTECVIITKNDAHRVKNTAMAEHYQKFSGDFKSTTCSVGRRIAKLCREHGVEQKVVKFDGKPVKATVGIELSEI